MCRRLLLHSLKKPLDGRESRLRSTHKAGLLRAAALNLGLGAVPQLDPLLTGRRQRPVRSGSQNYPLASLEHMRYDTGIS